MNQRVLLAALAGAVASFLIGGLVFGMLLEGFYKTELAAWSGMMKSAEDMGGMDYALMFIAQLSWATLAALIFSKWAGISNFKDGAMAGLWIGLLMNLGYDLMMMTYMNGFGMKIMVVDILANSFVWAVGSGVVGLVLGMGAKKA